MDLVYYGKIKSYVVNLLLFFFFYLTSDVVTEQCKDGMKTI